MCVTGKPEVGRLRDRSVHRGEHLEKQEDRTQDGVFKCHGKGVHLPRVLEIGESCVGRVEAQTLHRANPVQANTSKSNLSHPSLYYQGVPGKECSRVPCVLFYAKYNPSILL